MTHYLYQHGTLAYLVEGMFEGSLTMAELLQQGNFGIGTLEGLDGEVTILNGTAYHADSSGEVRILSEKETVQTLIPYGSVSNFDSKLSKKEKLVHTDLDEMKHRTLKLAKTNNALLSVHIKGNFQNVKIRIMPKQVVPYPRLVEVSDQQPEYEYASLSGDIIGFFTPSLLSGVAAPGFHLHFLSEDKKVSGHLLFAHAVNGKLEVQLVNSLLQHFPTVCPRFNDLIIKTDQLHAEMLQAEN
ncbi:acetolactate decarboxylase [Vagococcus entomophilus]|uniref:Alpha-acetolactate decarboxylase n=1 Tax=Vagococcus entomophilus TaxID=1160095 RepID=A0A430ALG0_9ENTE|nr:acetolactate decarboxylase [Vagococcus entomophilus]RSU08717.1 acetolactate decarboxylase [Vagococcus entomophilus]